MAVTLAGQVMPTSLSTRGSLYLFEPPRIVAINGAGVPVVTGNNTLSWGWTYCSDAEMVYLYTTVLGGLAAKQAAITVWNHLKVETAYSNAIIFRPTYSTFRNGHYMNVMLRIEDIYDA